MSACRKSCLLFTCFALFGGIALCDDYADLFKQAAADSQQGKYQQAILDYKAALAIHPEAPEALNNLAVMYYQTGKYLDALETASKVWPAHPNLKSAALILGMSAVQCNKPKAAVRPLEQLLGSDPSNRDALLALASARFALNDLSGATELYERQVAASSADSKAWYGLAICYERRAEDASKKLAQTPGGGGYSKRLLAEYFQTVGDSKLAAEAFGESQTGRSSPEAGRQYEIARQLADKSRSAFEHFVNLAPESWQAAVFSGDVDRQHGDFSSALAHYKKAAEVQPESPAPLLGMGTVYWELGEFDAATESLHKALRLKPDALQAIFELANIAVRRHKDTIAIPLLERYLASQPDATAAHADLGKAYFHLGRYKRAIPELTQAAESDEQGEIHYELSVALRKCGRPEEADEALKQSNDIRQSELQRERQLKPAK